MYFALTQLNVPRILAGNDTKESLTPGGPPALLTRESKICRCYPVAVSWCMQPNNLLAKQTEDLGLKQPASEYQTLWMQTSFEASVICVHIGRELKHDIVQSIPGAMKYWADVASAKAMESAGPNSLILVAEPNIRVDVPNENGAPRTLAMLIVNAPPGCNIDQFNGEMDQFFDEVVQLPTCKKNLLKHVYMRPIVGVPAHILPNFLHPGPEMAVVVTETASIEAVIEMMEDPGMKAQWGKKFFEGHPGAQATRFAVDAHTITLTL
ncbi:hypothetical protein HMN09_00943100 [Mycena chlorophos]|uniref:Uncharacterized protein n=1 Tax=Mycena chlorophos TaxID=658473 RepID=A0A8H6SKZ5_MYCCL|nr:hypothetical protein HMN09_00943100 [Mycena chlorophos]